MTVDARDPSSKYELFVHYYENRAILALEKDAAVKALRSAADAEYVAALHTLGMLMFRGEILPKNEENGLELLEKAGVAGDAVSQFVVAEIFMNRFYEQHVDDQNFANLDNAEKWLRIALYNKTLLDDLDVSYAKYYLGQALLVRDPADEEGWRALSEAAEGGVQAADDLKTKLQETVEDFAADGDERAKRIRQQLRSVRSTARDDSGN